MQFLPYLIAPLALTFLAFQLYPYFKLKASRGKAAPTLGKFLDGTAAKTERKLIYFMAPQCGMCRSITPIVDELAQQRNDIIRIDASESPEIAKEFNVMGTPAFVLVNSGVIEKVKLGGMTRKKILEMLEAQGSKD